jgi:dihydrodipicolinate synthase/N-acetylneuraminate lyase
MKSKRENKVRFDRRSFIRTMGLASAFGVSSLGANWNNNHVKIENKESPGNNNDSISPDEFKKRLEGPILSVPTPFNSEYEVDFDGLSTMIKRGISHGVPIIELTAGNTRYSMLSYEEIKEVAKVMVNSSEGKALTIAATGDWWTERSVDYARYVESVGADAIQVLLPKNNGGEESIVEHFKEIAKASSLPIVLHGIYSESLLDRLLEIDTIVAMKEDGPLTYYINRIIKYGDRLNIFSGGAKSRFLVGHPYGAKAFFSAFATFAPKIPMLFWKATQNNDLDEASEIIRKYDNPWGKYLLENPVGKFAFWSACLEYFNVAQRYQRKPLNTYTAQEMRDLKLFFDELGVYPEEYD